MPPLSLRKIRNSEFSGIYSKLLRGAELDELELVKVLQLAVVFLNSEVPEVHRLGYRLILLYSIKCRDYVPLYDVALNLGYFPVAKLIERTLGEDLFRNRFFRELQGALQDAFRRNTKHLTREQAHLYQSFQESVNTKTTAVIAPTSYGKTELILNSIDASKTIVIIVPTKALLAQTKKRIISSNAFDGKQKLITHHEMYVPGDKNFIAVLTQERVIKLLQQDGDLKFDMAFVDEAHNLLEDDNRSRLLAAAIAMLHHRNSRLSLHYFTPFLTDPSLLNVDYTDGTITGLTVSEYVKSEKVYLSDMRNGGTEIEVYDQFMNTFASLANESFTQDVDLITQRSGDKNIIYINRPADIERFVHRFIPSVGGVNDPEIESVCQSIEEFLHKDYSLLKCLRNGIVFHHGSVPDNVKLFVEHLYSKNMNIKYIVTTSTLLEGVNIPSSKLFLLANKKGNRALTASQFKNLIGRICRFSEIFDPQVGQPEMLQPEVYVIGSEYTDPRANLRTFLRKTLKMDLHVEDTAQNILLKASALPVEKKVDKVAFEQFLENIEPHVTKKKGIKTAKTSVGASCFANNVFEFDILGSEFTCQAKVDRLKGKGLQISSTEELLETIYEIFISRISDAEKHRNISRLRELGARNFYKMFLNWRIENASFKRMIASFLSYWNEIEETNDEPYVYVGKWGDRTKREGGFRTDWVNLKEKDHSARVNLAIARIKDEQDFVESYLSKYIEILHDEGLLDEGFYRRTKFGTADDEKILLIRNGISLSLASLLLEKYRSFVSVDQERGVIELDRSLIAHMTANEENDVLVFEATLNVR